MMSEYVKLHFDRVKGDSWFLRNVLRQHTATNKTKQKKRKENHTHEDSY